MKITVTVKDHKTNIHRKADYLRNFMMYQFRGISFTDKRSAKSWLHWVPNTPLMRGMELILVNTDTKETIKTRKF